MTTNALLAWPIVFSATSYVLRVTVDGTTTDLTFDVEPDRYYWMGRDGQADASTYGGVGDLLLVLKTCLETHPAVWTTTVTLDANFRVNIAIASGATTFGISWAHVNTTLPMAVFGFTGSTLVNGTVKAGSDLPYGLFRANRPVNIDGRPQVPVIGGVALTMLGDPCVNNFGFGSATRSIIFDRLTQDVTLTEYVAATSPTGSLEYAWLNAWALGYPLRLYLDESQLATGPTAYSLWAVTDLERPWRRASGYRIRWAAELAVAEVTS